MLYYVLSERITLSHDMRALLYIGIVNSTKEYVNAAVKNDTEKTVAGAVYRIIDNGDTVYIDFLWVSGELRGQGIGEKLINYMKEKAAALNCRRIQFYTVAYQAPGFYRKMGFTLTGTSPWENTTQFDYELAVN